MSKLSIVRSRGPVKAPLRAPLAGKPADPHAEIQEILTDLGAIGKRLTRFVGRVDLRGDVPLEYVALALKTAIGSGLGNALELLEAAGY